VLLWIAGVARLDFAPLCTDRLGDPILLACGLSGAEWKQGKPDHTSQGDDRQPRNSTDRFRMSKDREQEVVGM